MAEKFSGRMFIHFGLLESISDESKAKGRKQNFVLSLNIGLEMLYLFLFKSSEAFWKDLHSYF